MLFGRAFLFAYLANNAKGGENDKFPFEIQMMAFFYTGASKSTSNTNTFSFFLNRFGIIEQIA